MLLAGPLSRGRARHRLLEQLDRAPRVVGEREHLVELDLGAHAIPLDDAVETGAAVEALRVLQRLPLVDATGPAALAPDEVLADQALRLLEPRRNLVKVLSARRVVDRGRELVPDGRRDHIDL